MTPDPGLGAGVLVFAGSMTAALLALSDARADFATLGAVGAAPRTRRRIAGAYGWAIAFVGAALGAAVGFIPGVAITYPLTSNTGEPFVQEGMVGIDGTPIADHYLVIPWPMIAVLVVGPADRGRAVRGAVHPLEAADGRPDRMRLRQSVTAGPRPREAWGSPPRPRRGRPEPGVTIGRTGHVLIERAITLQASRRPTA